MITEIIEVVEKAKKETGISYAAICGSMDLPYANFMRWKIRAGAFLPVINRPGPKKIKPPDFDQELIDSIRNLDHKKRVSLGSGALYRQNAPFIPRRYFQTLVNMARFDFNVSQSKNLRRITWHIPGLVWSMDDSEYEKDIQGNKIYLHNTQDLASKYNFVPLAGHGLACGEEIAGHFADLSYQYGPPLFIKRDNHGNLNSLAVNDVLDEYFILPLNSPPYYAPYNGSIENSQGKLKDCMRQKMGPVPCCELGYYQAYAEAAVHELNHKSRPCLNGQNACRVFFNGRDRIKFNKRERRNIYDLTMELANSIFNKMKEKGKNAFESAWRIAVETWLRSKRYITVSINGKVLPLLMA
jgi:hypothetical protein